MSVDIDDNGRREPERCQRNRRDSNEKREWCERQMYEHKRKQRSSEPAVSWPKRIINSGHVLFFNGQQIGLLHNE